MKKIITMALAAVMIISVSSCGAKKAKLTLECDTSYDGMISADFFYPDNGKYTIDEKEDFWKIIKNEKENYELDISLFDDTTFDNNKEGSKEDEETYKEFKIGKYDAYGYEDFGGYTIYIHLEEVSETTDRYAVIEINAIDWSDDSVEGIEFYEGNKDVKTIVNSVVYNGATGENADSEETEEHEDETDAEEAEENE